MTVIYIIISINIGIDVYLVAIMGSKTANILAVIGFIAVSNSILNALVPFVPAEVISLVKSSDSSYRSQFGPLHVLKKEIALPILKTLGRDNLKNSYVVKNTSNYAEVEIPVQSSKIPWINKSSQKTINSYKLVMYGVNEGKKPYLELYRQYWDQTYFGLPWIKSQKAPLVELYSKKKKL